VLAGLQQSRLIAKCIRHIPPALFGRYILVGIWNTFFGYALYATLTALLTAHVPHAYILASLVASVINITVAFLGYKWFIFKTRGNYLREWIRCAAVYSGGILLGIVLLPIFVFVIRYFTRFDSAAPYLAGAILTIVNVVAGFMGHKNFTFSDTGGVRN
jgi:putative flippase GtrA